MKFTILSALFILASANALKAPSSALQNTPIQNAQMLKSGQPSQSRMTASEAAKHAALYDPTPRDPEPPYLDLKQMISASLGKHCAFTSSAAERLRQELRRGQEIDM
jgi:hypothetical protein